MSVHRLNRFLLLAAFPAEREPVSSRELAKRFIDDRSCREKIRQRVSGKMPTPGELL